MSSRVARRRHRPWPAPDQEDRGSLVGMAVSVLLLHLLGWGGLMLVAVPQAASTGLEAGYGVGMGLTAYLLGVRHAFDADHIAAVDSTTRKLVGEGKPALSVGFWFSLGHCSVVLALSFLLALGYRAVDGPDGDGHSRLQSTIQLLGSTTAGAFLVLIGLMNLVAVAGIARVFRRMRCRGLDEAELERQLGNQGVLARVLRQVLSRVGEPWHLNPVGLVMGLGLETATQVALLVLAAGSTASLPWYAILVLPALFTAGMCLCDTADGVLMARLYRWAFLEPARKVLYNLVLSALSAVLALVIGGTLLASQLIEHLGVQAGPLAWVSSWNSDYFGFVIAGLFVLVWALALVAWRLRLASAGCRKRP